MGATVAKLLVDVLGEVPAQPAPEIKNDKWSAIHANIEM